MASVASNLKQASSSPVTSLAIAQPFWYALYTCANHERSVAAELEVRTIEHFLPLYCSVRHWKDRRVTLDLPLFPGYVFVHLSLNVRIQVLQLPGVVKLVSFGGIPAALPDTQVEALRVGLNGWLCAQPHPYLSVGRRVRVVRGPFQGSEGILVRKKSGFRVVISLELIMRSVAFEVDLVDVESIC